MPKGRPIDPLIFRMMIFAGFLAMCCPVQDIVALFPPETGQGVKTGSGRLIEGELDIVNG